MDKKEPIPERSQPEVTCPVCGDIGTAASSFQKFGWPENDTSLPAAASNLTTVLTLSDTGSRKKLVQQCPACGDYFLYKLDYEFLAGGSEDDESLVRLSPEEARAYL